jgi:hypothetical protein
MSGLPVSTVSGCGVILVWILALQNAIKLGNAVVLLYQSPPPLYFKIASSCA